VAFGSSVEKTYREIHQSQGLCEYHQNSFHSNSWW